MKLPLYYLFKLYIKTSFLFYCKKIKVSGTRNIPKEDAVLFLANHPNGVIDPILIAASTKRPVNFLVQAGVFKNNTITTIFGWLGMLPVYRIRDGRKQLAKNNLIFEKCRKLFKEHKTLLIFPEGTHSKKRYIRTLNKGFTRIVFGALDDNPNIRIHIVPIGITYQDSSIYPSGVSVNYGNPIFVSEYYNGTEVFKSAIALKKKVAKELKKLSVHIDKENYNETIGTLNKLEIDYTEVNTVNNFIKTNNYPTSKKHRKRNFSILKTLIIINSVIPYLLWKKLDKFNKEVEFRDSLRLALNSITFPLFYTVQSILISYFFNWKIGLTYFICSLLLVILYTKTAN